MRATSTHQQTLSRSSACVCMRREAAKAVVHKLCVENETDKATGDTEAALGLCRAYPRVCSRVLYIQQNSPAAGRSVRNVQNGIHDEFCLKSKFSDTSTDLATRPLFAHQFSMHRRIFAAVYCVSDTISITASPTSVRGVCETKRF